MRILYPWLMYAEYENGKAVYFGGNSEYDCMDKIAQAEGWNGPCTYYTGVNDEDYVDGEYIERR